MAFDAAVAETLLFRGVPVSSSARWVWRGACAVLDQGLFALSNFAINVALARWLTPDGYGAFTFAYAVFLVLGTVHTALVAEPLIVFGASKYRHHLSPYVRVLMRGHWILTAICSVVLALAGTAFRVAAQPAIGNAFLALAVASPLVLFQWLMRRACYVRVGPQLAASGGLVYMAALAGGSYLLIRGGWMSSPAALLLMGTGSLLSALWIRAFLALEGTPADEGLHASARNDHWTYGRWAVGTGVLGAVMLNIYYLAMPPVHGLESTGTMRALTNFVMPAMQAYFALSVVTVPAFARVRHTPEFGHIIRRLLWLYGFGALAYWLVIGVGHSQLVHLLYGGKYVSESWLLWALGLMPFASAGISIFESALRSLERSDDIFRAYINAVVVSLVFGLPCMYFWGTGGAIGGLIVSAGVAVASLAIHLRRRIGTVAVATPEGSAHE